MLSVPGPRGSGEPELAGVVHRNISALLKLREEAERKKSVEERIADRITGFTGSMLFVYLHAIVFGTWIVVNLGLIPPVKPFDPFPFVMLAMIASVEAIFLSTFILISQNRMARMNERRAELDLQINLLSEHEVTRLIQLVDEIAKRLGVKPVEGKDLDQLKQDVHPETVIKEIEKTEEEPGKKSA